MIHAIKAYRSIVEKAHKAKAISETCYESLKGREFMDWDELEQSAHELVHSIQNCEYYITLERIAKGEALLEKETDEAKKTNYRKLLNDLLLKLERLTPKRIGA